MKLTIKQAADQAGVNELIIRKWIAEGKLDHSRTDNFIWIDCRDMQAAADHGRRESNKRMF